MRKKILTFSISIFLILFVYYLLFAQGIGDEGRGITKPNAPRNATYITQTPNDILTNEQALSASLTTNYLPKWSTTSLVNSLIYDDGTYVGIGTASPGDLLSIVSDSGVGGVESNVNLQVYGPEWNALYIINNARGTKASPLPVVSGDYIGGYRVNGYDGTNFVPVTTSIDTAVDGTVSTGIVPGRIQFYTMNTLGVWEPARMTIKNDGNVGIGTTSPSSLLEVAGAIETAFVAKTASYTVTASDSVLTSDATAGAVTFTLPTAVGIAGRRYTFKRIDASANNTIVDGSGTETIDGAATKTLGAQWSTIVIISDGANWIIEN